MSDRVHFSRLKLIEKSPAHYLANARADTSSLRAGRAAHSYLLGDTSKIIVYEGVRNKKTKKYQAFLEEHPGATVMSPSEMWEVQGMRRSIEKVPDAVRLLEGNREQYLEWETHGHACAGTPDVWREDGSVVELKTTVCAEPGAFLRDAERYAYHAQLAWYATGLVCAGSMPSMTNLSIVAVESAAPWPVTVFTLDRAIVAKGIERYRGWLETLETCQVFEEWPGYAKSAVRWDSLFSR